MNKLFVVVLAVIMSVLLYLLAPILTPFLIGALLAYLVNPLVDQLVRLHLPRLLAVGIIFLAVFSIILLLVLLVVPLIQEQIVTLSSVILNAVEWMQNTIVPLLKEYVGIEQFIDVNVLKTQLAQNLGTAGGAAAWLAEVVLHSGVALLHGLLNLILIPVVAFYLLYDWHKAIMGVHHLLPRQYEPTIIKLVNECDEVIGAFFRGQLMVMLALGVFYSVGLSLIGLQISLVIGLLVGLLSIVPYLGVVIGIITASIAAFVQFGTFISVLLVWLVFLVGQTLDGMFITPKLIGDRIGLHPVAVIFAVLAGGTLFGFFGVLLALPVAAIIMVLLRFLNHYYHATQL